jgi:hypothetical protein
MIGFMVFKSCGGATKDSTTDYADGADGKKVNPSSAVKILRSLRLLAAILRANLLKGLADDV